MANPAQPQEGKEEVQIGVRNNRAITATAGHFTEDQLSAIMEALQRKFGQRVDVTLERDKRDRQDDLIVCQVRPGSGGRTNATFSNIRSNLRHVIQESVEKLRSQTNPTEQPSRTSTQRQPKGHHRQAFGYAR